jgi:hypothetical protein
MLKFKVIAIDKALVRRIKGGLLEAKVYSVFPRSLNLIDNHGTLVTLLGEEKFKGPGIIQVNLNANFDTLGLSESEKIKLKFNFKPDSFFDCTITVNHEQHITLKNLKNNLKLLELKTNPPFPQAAKKFEMLCSAIKLEKNLPDILKTLNDLIGLGPGLTPSGDDMLLGLFAALWAFKKTGIEKFNHLLETFPACIEQLKARTSYISWNYLFYASQGQFSEPVLKLLYALFCENKKEITNTAQKLKSYGAWSGSDIIYGIKKGLEIVDGR